MRRFAASLILFLALLALSGCAQQTGGAPEAEPAETAAAPSPSAPGLHEIPEVSEEESAAMANWLCGSRALFVDTKLYTLDFDAQGSPELGRYWLVRGAMRHYITLAEACVPTYLQMYEERLYYINDLSGAIESVALRGEDRQILREGPCDFLQIFEGKLRYTDAAGRYCECETDGSGERVLIDARCFYPYSLGETVLYQNDAAGEKLFLRWLADGEERQLSRGPAYGPLVWEGKAFYSSGSALYSVELSGERAATYPLPPFRGELELLPIGGTLHLRGLHFAETPLQWAGDLKQQEQQDIGSYRLCEYFGGACRVDCVYEPDKRIRCFAFYDEEGNEYRYFAGKAA